MRNAVLSLILAFCTVTAGTAAADTFAAATAPGGEAQPSIPDIERDIESLKRRGSGTTDPALKADIAVLVKALEEAKDWRRLADMRLGSNLGRELLRELKARREGSKLRLAGDLVLDPAGGESAALTPALSAGYKQRTYFRIFPLKKPAADSLAHRIAVQYDVNLQIQAPASQTTTEATVQRLLLSGADGSLQLGGKVGGIGAGRALVFGASGNLNWLNEPSAGQQTVTSFAYQSLSICLIGRLGPAVAGVMREFRQVPGERESALARAIHKARSDLAVVGLAAESTSITLRYLLGTNRPKQNNENLEIRFGVAYEPF